tara:strand:+ start:223 stop:579 length:357 start_codon:yes stop_codon:yes gene_type:complete
MSQFKGFRVVSSKIIKNFGANVVYQKINNGKYNLEKGEVGESITELSIFGFLEDVKKQEVNSLIQQTDKKLNISREDINFEPTPQDRVKIAGIIYTVITVQKEMVNGEDVFYTLFLRA